MRYLLAAASIVAISAASLGSAAAQTVATQQTIADPSTVEGEDVVVTAQRANQTEVIRGGSVGVLGDKSAADTPFSIKSYGEQLILNQQPQTLGQVLENDPSIRTTYGFGNASEQFVVRGFALYGDDIGLNGLYGITPRQLVAPELYGQVQVLEGASAFLNGAAPGGSGIGGSVNLVTKTAGVTPLTRVTAEYTSHANFGGSFDVARPLDDGRIGVRVNSAVRSGNVGIDGEDRRAYVVGASVDYRGDRLRLFIDAAYQRYEVYHLRPTVSLGAGVPIPRVPDAAHNFGQAFASTKLRDIFGTFRGEYDLASNALFYVSAGARDGSENGLYDGITVTNAATGAATGNALLVPRTDNNEAVQAGIRVKLAAGGVTNEINFGGSYVWQVNRNAYDFRYGPGFAGYVTNLYNTPQVAVPSSTLTGGNLADPFPIARERLGSAFASDTLGLFDDHVLVTGGLRLQAILVKRYSYADGSPQTTYDRDAVTPVAGVVVKPLDRVSLFFNRIEGLVQGDTAPIGTNVTNPGAVLPPFRSVQYEAGGKYLMGRRLNLSAAVFQIDRPSAFSIATPTAANPNAVTFGSYGQQRNRGVEVSLDGEPVAGLRVIAGATYLDAKLRRTSGGVNEGSTAIGVPDWLANANVEWDLPFLRGATLTGRVTYTGRQWVDAANTLRLDDWTRFDLGARYVLDVADRPVTLRATVDNVANRRYWASAFGTFGAALLQGTPRTFKASATIGF